MQSNSPPAEQAYRQSLALDEKLVAAGPSECSWQRSVTLWRLANVLQRTGRTQEAEETYRQALTMLATLQANFPHVPE